MTSKTMDRACSFFINRLNLADDVSMLILLGLLSVTLTGCGRQSDTTPVKARNTSAPNLAAAVAAQPAPQPSQVGEELINKGPIPHYELRMDPNELLAFERGAFSNNTHPATFIADGEVYEKVKVRFRGAFARSWPKKPIKIIFNDAKPFHGQYHLNLNSGWRDPAFVRETLAYHVYSACGSPASRSRMVRLDMNGQFRGLYVEVEQPDKAFASRLNLKGASIYKASSRANQADERDLGSETLFRAHYTKETQKSEGYGELQKFCHELASTGNVADFFNRHVDLEKYVNYLAATALIQNWDGYNKNHFIFYDGRGSKKWVPVPWDLDRTFGDYWDSSFDKADLPALAGTQQLRGVTGWNRMADRFFSDPALKARFFTRLGELLEKEFTTEKLFPILDRMESQISADAAQDRRRWPGQNPDFHSGIAQVKRFIEHRRAYLLKEVARMRRS